QEKFTLLGHSHWVRAIAVTPDGKTAISGSGDNAIKTWDLETGQEKLTLKNHSYWVYAIAVTPDGLTVVAGEASGTLHFLRLQERGSGRINVIT
ncbi:MAG: WD40 repeat domain-containing protein, partial [Dolichospermum sp.]